MFALFTSVNALPDCRFKALEPTTFTSALGGVGSHVHGCSTSFNCNLYHWKGEDDGHIVELVCSDVEACGLATFEGDVPTSQSMMAGMLQSIQTKSHFFHKIEGLNPAPRPHSGATGRVDGTSVTVRREIVPSNGFLYMAAAVGQGGSSWFSHSSKERIQVEVPVVTTVTAGTTVAPVVTTAAPVTTTVTAAPVTTTVTAGTTVAPVVTTEGTTAAPVKTTVTEGTTVAPVKTTVTEGTTVAPVKTTVTEETVTVTVVTEETVPVTKATGKEETVPVTEAPEVPTTTTVTPTSSDNTPTTTEKGHALNVSDSGPGLSGVAITFIILGCLMVISVGVYAIYSSRTGLPRLSTKFTEVEE